MQKIKTIGVKDALELMRRNGELPYQHERLPDTFVEKAGRVYDRLKGIDHEVDKVSREEWVDDFRKEPNFEAELEVLVQCLAAVSKWQRKYGSQTKTVCSGIYYLARTRSCCQDPKQAFRETEQCFGFQFCESDKKRLMRVIDSCVAYLPIIAVGTKGQTAAKRLLESDYGFGKSWCPFLPNDEGNN